MFAILPSNLRETELSLTTGATLTLVLDKYPSFNTGFL
jgi:hypothetical protein